MKNYFRAVSARRNVPQSDDVARGLQVGESFGKLLGGLGTAITNARQSAARNQVANQLLSQNYPDTPADSNLDPNADLSTDLPEDVSSDVGGAASPGVQGNFQGGVDELKMRQEAAKEALSQQIDQQNLQSSIAKTRAAQGLATLRGNIAANQPAGGLQPQTGNAGAWSGYQMPGGTTPTTGSQRSGGKKGAAPEAPVVIGSEPVTDQNQLISHFDGTYGKGTFARSMANIDTAKLTDDGNHVTIGPPDKELTIPIGDAQVYTRQMNALRLKQGLAPFPVPGEDATLGNSAANPYIAKNNLDVYSRPSGSWVMLPNKKIAQVP
jgi:hypothetical protein